MSLTRKEFLSSMVSAAAGLAGVAVLAACGDDGGNVDAGGSAVNCVANGTAVTIGGNHGHVLVVSKDDVYNAAEKIYNIKGSSSHEHTVKITAAQFMMLKANMTLSTNIEPDSTGHPHAITVMCA